VSGKALIYSGLRTAIFAGCGQGSRMHLAGKYLDSLADSDVL
jgi:hypothetical protein